MLCCISLEAVVVVHYPAKKPFVGYCDGLCLCNILGPLWLHVGRGCPWEWGVV
jgi:hypothetical protein